MSHLTKSRMKHINKPHAIPRNRDFDFDQRVIRHCRLNLKVRRFQCRNTRKTHTPVTNSQKPTNETRATGFTITIFHCTALASNIIRAKRSDVLRTLNRKTRSRQSWFDLIGSSPSRQG